MDAILAQENKNTAEEQPATAIRQANRWYLLGKRCFDFISSLFLSIALVIPMGMIAVLIMAKDLGSPLYMQKRVGQYGKEIIILKFRSMRKNADCLEDMLNPEQLALYKKEYKLDDDPRLIGYEKAGDGRTCFGAWLRRASLDELPQIIWNICIKGDMSMVGPRPILHEELLKNYTPEEQKLLLSAKPGLTGYWQAYARNNAGYADHRRQEMELYYAQNASPLLDGKIIWKTIFSLIRQEGVA